MDDPLDTALTHVSTVYGLYVTQRQNVVNFYLAGVALLSVAYAAAINKGQAPVAVAVCALGVLASAAAYLQDMRLRPATSVLGPGFQRSLSYLPVSLWPAWPS